MDESNSSNDKGNNGPGNNDNDPTQGNQKNENQNVAEPTGDKSLSDDTSRESVNQVRTTVSPVRRISFTSSPQTGSSMIRSLLTGSKRPSTSTEGHPGPAKAPQKGLASTFSPRCSSMSQPGPSSMSQPGPSSMSQPGPSSMSQPGPSSMSQPGPSSMSQQGPSSMATVNALMGAPIHIDMNMLQHRHMEIEEQKYVDDICREGYTGAVAGEDSSYDSDYEADAPAKHQDVSRTTSDTLAAEYADYIQTSPDSDPGYIARVEFALKLGYTEKQVQAALQKLGPAPAQNELLAELIKLGAQKGGSCDSSPSESQLDISEQVDVTLNAQTLRPIVIDGSNVAMSHGNKEVFSCRGIKICVDWFKARGHKDITVFVPKWRKEGPRPDNPISDQEILAELEKDRLLVFTPSRLVGGKRMVCYDDRYILRLAAANDGVVVSNDNYRDLCQESTEFRKVVEERILMYSFVNDRFMPPDDPLGRSGPTLDNFLRTQPRKGDPPPPCPYGKKCTYGNKCKYHHPERGPLPHKTVTERLSEHAQRHLQAREGDVRKTPLGRTRSNVPPPKEIQHPIVSKSQSVDNVGASYQNMQSPENLHRKLQRQLTLNPNSDPRLISRRYMPVQPSNSNPLQSTLQNPFLSPTNWDMHQHVTRIASAPDSYRNWPQTQNVAHRPMHRLSSCSDPQLNIWAAQWAGQPSVSSHSLLEETRRKMHYHLAAIFPEEQVTHAMQLFPEETNPQKICAAILSIFHKT